ncbi:hypothetical protein Scep_012927 [Stephania cephalantha]|uniref:Uncharacterized protein n=1 Tax=Stephania cephalantha TaxID=152367 RepID=A0AAP0JGC7_9MAGN
MHASRLLSLPRDSCCTNVEDTFDLKSKEKENKKKKYIYIYIKKEIRLKREKQMREERES